VGITPRWEEAGAGLSGSGVVSARHDDLPAGEVGAASLYCTRCSTVGAGPGVEEQEFGAEQA
jgi:hypothetical protein